MTDCVFCKIVAGQIPAETAHEDNEILAFSDIHPKAPVHLLIVPRKHVPTASELARESPALAGRMLQVAAELARAKGIEESGYRLILNCNRDGGQEVFHVHVHLLGGRPLGPMVAR